MNFTPLYNRRFVLKSKYIDLATSTCDSLDAGTLHPIYDSPETYPWRQYTVSLVPVQTDQIVLFFCDWSKTSKVLKFQLKMMKNEVFFLSV